jgi:hypothetical protein
MYSYSNPWTGLDRPRRFQEDEAPRFPDSRCMKVVRLSALLTEHLHFPRNIPVLTTVRGGIDLWFILLQGGKKFE